jgi:hypothetical protein
MMLTQLSQVQYWFIHGKNSLIIEHNQEEPLTGLHFKGWLLVLSTNIRFVGKGVSVTNALAYDTAMLIL